MALFLRAAPLRAAMPAIRAMPVARALPAPRPVRPELCRAFASGALPGGERPFRVLGLQQVWACCARASRARSPRRRQVAVGGTDKTKLAHLWTTLLGVQKVKSFSSAKENVDEDVLLCGRGPMAVEVDLMQVRARACARLWRLACARTRAPARAAAGP